MNSIFYFALREGLEPPTQWLPLHLIICPPNFWGDSNSLQQYLHLYIAGAEGFEPSISRLTVWRYIPLKLHPNGVREFFILFVVVDPENTPQLLGRYLKSSGWWGMIPRPRHLKYRILPIELYPDINSWERQDSNLLNQTVTDLQSVATLQLRRTPHSSF